MNRVLAIALAAVTVTAAQEPAPQQPSDIRAVITGDPGAPPRYAVPDFIALTPSAAELGRQLGQVLWDDLNFEREFYMVPRDVYKTIPVARTEREIPFAAWRELGADGVVFGTVEQTGTDVKVQVRVYNVRTGESVLAQEYVSVARNARRIAHTVADLIHSQQRNLKGVALTRLAFVSTRQRQSLLGTVEKRDAKEIYIADYDGANQQQITTTKQLNLSPSWSADARALAYASYRDVQPKILISHLSTGILQQLTKAPGSHSLPVYSPDGTRIAFSSVRGDGNVEIYVVNADGSNERRLTTHPDADTTPTWSPSGNQIAFTSDRSGRETIYIMNADGTGVRRLEIPESRADRASWAPAPYNEIAYSGWTGSGWDIKVFDLSSNTSRAITFGEGSNESPAFSPTGRHIAFQSSRGSGRFQIYTIARTGDQATLRQVTREGENTMPDWSNSPSGSTRER